MFKCIIAALLLLEIAIPARAADDNAGAVVIPAPSVVQKSRAQLPSCNDPQIIDGVRRSLTSYYEANFEAALIEKRRRRLLLQNLAHFETLDVASFDNRENYQVADRIIMAKINRGAASENMLLCRNEFKFRDEPLYLLAYPFDLGLAVEVINFGNLSPDAESGHFFIPLSE